LKIENDKYYTSSQLAKYCVRKTKEIIGGNNIAEYIEPSAGNGVFLEFLDKPYKAYDIEPEDNRIIQQDYLTLELGHLKNRCIIGNPPFGKNTLVIQFYNKSIELGDYIAFILPISQLDNNYQLFKFDLLYSEDLGLRKYSNINLHCCFNVYKRPTGEKLNKRPNYKLKDVELKEYRRNEKDIPLDFNYDIGICSFGKGIIGRITNHENQYCKEIYFKIHNDNIKDKILNLIINTDWEKEVCKGISGQNNLSMWRVYRYIKEQIPEIE